MRVILPAAVILLFVAGCESVKCFESQRESGYCSKKGETGCKICTGQVCIKGQGNAEITGQKGKRTVYAQRCEKELPKSAKNSCFKNHKFTLGPLGSLTLDGCGCSKDYCNSKDAQSSAATLALSLPLLLSAVALFY